MSLPSVAMLSLWREDRGRRLHERALGLLTKTYPLLRWIWVVGESADGTYDMLRRIVEGHPNGKRVTLVSVPRSAGDRYSALSADANAGLDFISAADDRVVIHESDLVSPEDVIERMLVSGKCPVAGWVTLTLPHVGEVFYDIWAYRAGGVQFSNLPPFHAVYRPREIFEVDSVGSCWMMYGEDIRAGVRCRSRAVLDLCAQMRERGRRFWVDPMLHIVQPFDLWQEHDATA